MVLGLEKAIYNGTYITTDRALLRIMDYGQRKIG